MLTKEKAIPIINDCVCDECGVGKMRPNGPVCLVNPPKYTHKCTHCDNKQLFTVKYPHVTYESESKTETA